MTYLCVFAGYILLIDVGNKDTLLSRSFGSVSKSVEEKLEDDKKIKEQTHLNIFMVGVNSGKLYLSIFGLCPCGVVDMNSCISGRAFSILDADVPDDLNALFLVMSCWKEVGEMKEDKKGLFLVLLDTPVLAVHSSCFGSEAWPHCQSFRLSVSHHAVYHRGLGKHFIGNGFQACFVCSYGSWGIGVGRLLGSPDVRDTVG